MKKLRWSRSTAMAAQGGGFSELSSGVSPSARGLRPFQGFRGEGAAATHWRVLFVAGSVVEIRSEIGIVTLTLIPSPVQIVPVTIRFLHGMKIERSVRTLGEADLKGKKVFVRADLDVPLHDAQKITDDTRIRASVPTIKFLVKKGAKVILASHLGNPKGVTPKFSLKPLVPRLSELLGFDVLMANDCIGAEVEKLAAALPEGGVLLLENVRFYKGEEKNDLEFAKKLASVADLYVNDAFGTPHWAHASTQGVSKFLRLLVAGFFLMQKPSEKVDKDILIKGALSRITRYTLTVDSADCCEALVSANGVHILENQIDRSNQKVQNEVLYTLWNVAQFPYLLTVLAYDSLVDTLFVDLMSGNSEAFFIACDILKKLCESLGKHEIPGSFQRRIILLRTEVELRERHANQRKKRYTPTEVLEDESRQLREIRVVCQLIEKLLKPQNLVSGSDCRREVNFIDRHDGTPLCRQANSL